MEHPADKDDLLELKKASSLAEAPMADSENCLKELEQILLKAKDKKERNEVIMQAYEKGLSQHRIAQILKISQPAVSGIIKRWKR